MHEKNRKGCDGGKKERNHDTEVDYGKESVSESRGWRVCTIKR